MGEDHDNRVNDRPATLRIVRPEELDTGPAVPEGGWNTDKPRANMRGLPLALLLSVALWVMIALVAKWLWSLVGA